MSGQPQFTQEVRATLFKERMFSGTHHCFFEVKVANNGSKHIVLEQRRKVGEEFVGTKMRIFEDELLEFQRVLDRMIRLTMSAEVQERKPPVLEALGTPPYRRPL